ncbi:hypothetical protein [Pontimicrobium aquaticum]|uniref:Uncharacterized protein n=1 Tax=Pontimicrobium aquaticum TaxID=2565367 RepID=A0A4U0ER23_9FLAO|nr:hypothetical protein [Pontimicrobium aquaticum]TJY34090.1 hypothetical protein E5167_12305 [Pontimicrobium aquaticum]
MRNLNITQLVEAWIHISPSFRVSELPNNIFQVIARANMLGTDTSNPDSRGAKVYSEPQNLPTAIASILNHVENRANFHPQSQSGERLVSDFINYLKQINLTPFFALEKEESRVNKFESKNYNVLIDQIISLYDGVLSKSDENAMRKSIADMAKSVFGRDPLHDQKTAFLLTTIDMANPLLPRILIYYTTLHMKYVKGKSEIRLQEYQVNKQEYAVLPDFIRAYANKLSVLPRTPVDQWILESSSPERVNAKLCFQVSKAQRN